MPPVSVCLRVGLYLVFAWLLIGCSIETRPCSEVDQDAIYQSLSAEYDKQDDTSSVRATLRFGGPTGTTLEMDQNCDIAHNAFSLSIAPLAELLGTHYIGSGDGETLTHTFTFTDNELRTYVNGVTLIPIEIATPVGTISKASDFIVTWSGAAKANDEDIYFHLQYQDGESTVSKWYSSSSASGNSMMVPSSFFDEVATGSDRSIWVVRRIGRTVTQGTDEGGWVSGSYGSAHQTVTIAE